MGKSGGKSCRLMSVDFSLLFCGRVYSVWVCVGVCIKVANWFLWIFTYKTGESAVFRLAARKQRAGALN